MRDLIILDPEDEHLRNAYNWILDGKGYVCYHTHFQKFRLHRLVLKLHGTSVQVDHINRDKLDNRKCNLRVCTTAQNCQNQSMRANNKSGYKGVSFDKKAAYWRTCISCNNKFKQVYSSYDSKEECAYAYNVAASLLHKEFAYTNPVELSEERKLFVESEVRKNVARKFNVNQS